ncbi:hypothetical protein, partial [Minwuia sp.]|uniref:hypothetical protein n=1 Tax=Minwuia sp. TaxID=2493630 RepID=UPI003A8F71C1
HHAKGVRQLHHQCRIRFNLILERSREYHGEAFDPETGARVHVDASNDDQNQIQVFADNYENMSRLSTSNQLQEFEISHADFEKFQFLVENMSRIIIDYEVPYKFYEIGVGERNAGNRNGVTRLIILLVGVDVDIAREKFQSNSPDIDVRATPGSH